MKLQWIRSHWTPDESKQAQDWVINAVSVSVVDTDLDDLSY